MGDKSSRLSDSINIIGLNVIFGLKSIVIEEC
jgi:hypothetical protein